MKFQTCFERARFPFPLLILAFLFLVTVSARQTGCRRRMSADAITPAISVQPSAFLLKKLQQNALGNIRSLNAKAKIYAENADVSVEASANLVWLRDSALWINIKKLGIEAARALITRDSVIVLNRLDNTYTAREIGALQRQYSLPEGFPLLQNLLLAAAWVAPDMVLQSDIKDELHRLSGSNNRYAADYRIEEGSFTLRQETFVQQLDSRILTLQFDGFKKLPGVGSFPYLRRLEAFSPETGNLRLEIELTDVEVNVPKTFRFEIPAHYLRVE